MAKSKIRQRKPVRSAAPPKSKPKAAARTRTAPAVVERIPAPAAPRVPSRPPRVGTIPGQVLHDAPLNGVALAPAGVPALAAPAPPAPAPAPIPPDERPLVRPLGETYAAEVEAHLPHIQALVTQRMEQGFHPEPILFAMACAMGNYADLVCSPATGDDLVDRLCVQIRNTVQNVRRARAAAQTSSPAALAP